MNGNNFLYIFFLRNIICSLPFSSLVSRNFLLHSPISPLQNSFSFSNISFSFFISSIRFFQSFFLLSFLHYLTYLPTPSTSSLSTPAQTSPTYLQPFQISFSHHPILF